MVQLIDATFWDKLDFMFWNLKHVVYGLKEWGTFRFLVTSSFEEEISCSLMFIASPLLSLTNIQ